MDTYRWKNISNIYNFVLLFGRMLQMHWEVIVKWIWVAAPMWLISCLSVFSVEALKNENEKNNQAQSKGKDPYKNIQLFDIMF